MKKLLFVALFISIQVFSQNIAFDLAFIDAENIQAYDKNLKTKYQRLNQNYIDDGRILGWHVWKVINGAQSPFSHLAVSVYDMDKMDEDYTPKKWTEEFTDMAKSELMDWDKRIVKTEKLYLKLNL